MESKRFTFNAEDLKKVIKNLVIFALPDFIVFLVALSAKFSAEGSLFAVLLLNLFIDALRKFVAGKAQ